MCKIMIIPSVKREKVKNVWKFAKEIAPLMHKHDNDGFGFAAMDSNGQIIGEKWAEVELAMKDNCGLSKSDQKLIELMGTDFIKEEFASIQYGDLEEKNKNSIVSLMLHARNATTPKGLKNSHPFVKEETALIHNGVINNHHKLTKEMSECDSEAILHEYLNNAVAYDPAGLQQVVNALEGYYACGVLTKNEQGIPIVDVFKNFNAKLFFTFVDELDNVVFCTSDDMIKEALTSLKWNKNKIFEFPATGFIRFNALTGEKLHSEIMTKVYTSTNWRDKRYPDNNDYIGNVIDASVEEIDYAAMIEEDERKRVEENVRNAHGYNNYGD